jgi:hypothetical protein
MIPNFKPLHNLSSNLNTLKVTPKLSDVHYKEFSLLLSHKLLEFQKVVSIPYTIELIAEELSHIITKYPNIKLIPEGQKKSITKGINTILKNKFTQITTKLWEEAFELGLNHTIGELIYTSSKLFKGKEADFSSDDIYTARFASKDDASIRREMTNLEKYGAPLIDYLKDRDAYVIDSSLITRQTLEEKYVFLDGLLQVADTYKKGEATKNRFLADTYIRNRLRTLRDRYADSYDAAIKTQVFDLLSKDNYFNYKIERRELDVIQARQSIQQILTNAYREDNNLIDNPATKASTFLRTELGTAYNFGKIAAFSGSEEDLKREWEVVVDWEMQRTKPGYQICQFCLAHNGLRQTTAEILMRSGALKFNYSGSESSTTQWRNWSSPVLIFHPNCFTEGTSVVVYNPIVNAYYNKNIEHIKVGEYVKVPTEAKYRQVIETHKNWTDEPTYEIQTDSGQRIIATGNHPMWDGTDWKETRHFHIGECLYVCVSKNKRNNARSIKVISRNSRLHKISCSTKVFKSTCDKSKEIIRHTQNTKSSIERKECIFGNARKSFKKNESAQSNEQSRDEKKGNIKSFKINERQTTLFSKEYQNAEWERGSLQKRISRRYRAFRKKCLGSKCSKDTTETRIKLRVRKSNSFIQRKKLFSRFLSYRLGCLHRGQRILVARWKREMGIISDRVSRIQNSFNRQELLSATNEDFQGLMPVRITSKKEIIKPQYVYNLSVDTDPYYFAEDILVHNCLCRYVLTPKISDTKTNTALAGAALVAGSLVLGGLFLLTKGQGYNVLVSSAKAAAKEARTVSKPVVEVTSKVSEPILETMKEGIDIIQKTQAPEVAKQYFTILSTNMSNLDIYLKPLKEFT